MGAGAKPPIPNPQSPIPNPQSPNYIGFLKYKFYNKYKIKIKIK
jgi:hypothetical protein